MPGRPRRTTLSEAHWKAIKLVEEGNLNVTEICREMKWNRKYFYALRVGNVEIGGSIAELFSSEYKKAEEKRDKETLFMLKQNLSVIIFSMCSVFLEGVLPPLRNVSKRETGKQVLLICSGKVLCW